MIGATWNLRRLLIALTAVVVAAAVIVGGSRMFAQRAKPPEPSHVARDTSRFTPSEAEWTSLTTEPAKEQLFRAERVTEGKIAVNEDSSTPIFSPYAGRVTKLLVKPSDTVERGQPLFIIEATDTVQALNDFAAGLSALNSARSKLNLAQIVEKRQNDLYAGKAVPLKDWQQAQSDLTTAQNDVRAAETSVEAARNRLRILGRSEEQISTFEQSRQISADTPIYSPLAGTVVQRKVGPGQYVNTSSNSAAANDATFIIGDLSTVWLIAYVRETDAPEVHVGQPISFSVMAFPNRVFTAYISYVATSLDPATRRLLVRATIDNKEGVFRPEMFARVTIFTGEGDSSLAVPREAVIYDGKTTHVWVARENHVVERREIKTGLSNGPMVQVLSGLRLGESVVSKGSLFVDRAAAGS